MATTDPPCRKLRDEGGAPGILPVGRQTQTGHYDRKGCALDERLGWRQLDAGRGRRREDVDCSFNRGYA